MIDMLKNILQQEWFWAMMQFFVIAATLILIYLQVKIQTSGHVVQTLTTIDNRWNSEPMLLARHKVCSDWLSGKREFEGAYEHIANFMEELGIYLQIKAISDQTLWELQSWFVEHYYCMFKDGIDQVRGHYHDANLYTQFERLNIRMNDLKSSNNSPAFKRNEVELKRFAEHEIQLTRAILNLQESGSPNTKSRT